MSELEFGAGASNDYFSVDDILASNIMVPCKTEMDLSKLGILDPSSNDEFSDIPSGTMVEVPLWMLHSLGQDGRRHFAPSFPIAYQDIYREVLKADPTVVDLHKVGPYFYDSGAKLATLQHPEKEQLAEILPNTLKLRLQKIADSYTYSRLFYMVDEAPQDTKDNLISDATLDQLESRIYGDAKQVFAEHREWMEVEGRNEI